MSRGFTFASREMACAVILPMPGILVRAIWTDRVPSRSVFLTRTKYLMSLSGAFSGVFSGALSFRLLRCLLHALLRSFLLHLLRSPVLCFLLCLHPIAP